MDTVNIGWLDGAVIASYFVVVLAFGIWASRRIKQNSISGYFLASRDTHWIPLGASLFSSCIGAAHFIGLAGSAAASGIAVAGFEIGAVFVLMLLGWIFSPVYLSSNVYTMPDYLRKRFGGQRIQIYFAILSLILYVFTKISADLYAGALFIQMALNKSSTEWMYISISILLLTSALFTLTGGLTAVIWTDFVQTIIMIMGAFILMGRVFYTVGGFNALLMEYPYAVASNLSTNNSCGRPPGDYMNILRTIEPGKADLPWTGLVFGLTINAIWYWCTDQVIVQRTLSSRSMLHAKAGCIFASYIKILPLFILIFPGMAARILYPDLVACVDPEKCTSICGNPAGCSNVAYILLIIKLMPTGLSGLMFSVMMAAVMSSLTSIFNSSSTIFTMDIWTRLRKNPSNRELLIVGRIAVVVTALISSLWIPVIRNTGNAKLFDYIQSITAFLAPSVCAIFLLAVFCPRINEPGAFWSLVIGLAIGLIRFVLEFTFPQPPCGSPNPDDRPSVIKWAVDRVHYLHFSCILFLLTGLFALFISFLTRPIPKECLYRLTFWSRHHPDVREPMPTGCTRDLELTGIKRRPEDYNEEQRIAKAEADYLKEDPKWKIFVDANAVICIVLTVFIWGFFA